MVADLNGDFYQPSPRLVEGLKNEHVTLAACGRAHSLAVTQDGRLYVWGSADHGRLGALYPHDIMESEILVNSCRARERLRTSD